MGPWGLLASQPSSQWALDSKKQGAWLLHICGHTDTHMNTQEMGGLIFRVRGKAREGFPKI